MMIFRQRITVLREGTESFNLDASVQYLNLEDNRGASEIKILSEVPLNDTSYQDLPDVILWAGKSFEITSSRIAGFGMRQEHCRSTAEEVERCECKIYKRNAPSGEWGNTGKDELVATLQGRLKVISGRKEFDKGKESVVLTHHLNIPLIEAPLNGFVISGDIKYEILFTRRVGQSSGDGSGGVPVNSFEDGMDSIMRGIEGHLSQALDTSTVILKNSIRGEAPELSGLLKSDIQHKVDRLKKQGEVFDESEYSKRIQYGMKKTDALGRVYHVAPNKFYHRGADNAERSDHSDNQVSFKKSCESRLQESESMIPEKELFTFFKG